MRISDWSSDVCSSDLAPIVPTASHHPPQDIVLPEEVVQQGNAAMADDQDEQRPGDRRMETAQTGHPRNLAALGDQLDTESRPAMTAAQHGERSEEHTSELQSLMRISYAVFCLKKKNTTNIHK